MSEKENNQDEIFEETLKEQQREMLDSDGAESDFLCGHHSYSGEEEQINAALLANVEPELTDLPEEPESIVLPAEPESNDLRADADFKSTEVDADSKSTDTDLPIAASINPNLVSSADFEGIRNFDQLLHEGLPKLLLKKICIKYTKEDLLEIRQNRNEEEWKDYLWKNHNDNWPLGDEPFEMDPEMRCPFWKRREIQRKRQEEVQRWLSLGRASNIAPALKPSRPKIVANANSSSARPKFPKKDRNNKQGNRPSSSSSAAFISGKQSEPIHMNVSKNSQQKNSWVLHFNRFCQDKKETPEENNNNAKKAEEKWKKSKEAAEMDWTDSECEDEETSTDEEEEKEEVWALATDVFKIGQKNEKKLSKNYFAKNLNKDVDQKPNKKEQKGLEQGREEKGLQQSQPNKTNTEHSSEQSTSSYFPFTSPPPLQASWILSQQLVQSYMVGVNKLIRELSLSSNTKK